MNDVEKLYKAAEKAQTQAQAMQAELDRTRAELEEKRLKVAEAVMNGKSRTEAARELRDLEALESAQAAAVAHSVNQADEAQAKAEQSDFDTRKAAAVAEAKIQAAALQGEINAVFGDALGMEKRVKDLAERLHKVPGVILFRSGARGENVVGPRQYFDYDTEYGLVLRLYDSLKTWIPAHEYHHPER